jgi:hypothetical protein
MDMKSLDDVLVNFDPGKQEATFHERNKPLTVWVPNETKEMYDTIQNNSGFEFSKRLREIIILAIEKTASRTQ